MVAPIKRIVIGYDGFPESETIFADLPLAGLPSEADVLVVSAANLVAPPVASRPPGAPAWAKKADAEHRRLLKAAETTAARGARRLHSLFPKWKLSSEGGWNAAPWALIAAAERIDAQLIVVGARRNSRASRFLGSVSQQVLIHAACGVRVAREPDLMDRATPRVLVAVDDSVGAAAAIDMVLARPWLSITEVKILAVARKSDEPGDLFHKQSLQTFTAGEAERVRQSGLAASSVVREGPVINTVLAEAQRWGATSILIGARGISPLRRLVVGSVSQAVASRAACTVELVR